MQLNPSLVSKYSKLIFILKKLRVFYNNLISLLLLFFIILIIFVDFNISKKSFGSLILVSK